VPLRNFPPGPLPPISKGDGSSARNQRDQVQGLQDSKPELSGKHTRGEDVLYCFLCLVTKEAPVWVRKSSLLGRGHDDTSGNDPELKHKSRIAFSGATTIFRYKS
jgi:hypothetical protein